MTYYNKPKKYL